LEAFYFEMCECDEGVRPILSSCSWRYKYVLFGVWTPSRIFSSVYEIRLSETETVRHWTDVRNRRTPELSPVIGEAG
jgi:hypothetical protein